MNEVTSRVLHALMSPADALLDPSRRVFWPALAGSLAIALVTLVARGVGARRALAGLFSRRVWTHRSALVDYQLLALKGLLRFALLGAFGLSSLAIAGLTAGYLRRSLGLPGLSLHPAALAALFTVTAFVFEDLTRYLVHRLFHRVPLLWEFHKVHHSAEVLTPLSLYRTHPVEAGLNGARSALAVGLVTGLFSWLFGPGLRMWEVLGVDALGLVWTALGANLRHSHVWLSYGHRVERFFMSPAQHQVHHSADARHFDKNFGTVFGVWDWLGGTLYTTSRAREALVFGLPSEEAHPGRSALALLLKPFALAAGRLVPTRAPQPALASVALASASLCMAGCTPAAPPRVDRGMLLQSLGRCAMDTHASFQTAATALETAASGWAAAPSDATRAAARAAWEQAIDVWQRAELLRFGPAADLDTLGGQNLRMQIYSWPDVNRCLIEETLVSRGYEGNVGALSNSVRGLGALEYLLFYEGAENGCPSDNALNAMGTWAALSPTERTQRRANYARAVATDVLARSRALVMAWEPAGFFEQLTTAGRGSTLFATQQQALSAVAEGAFYLDTDTKDLRLGAPLGLVHCTGALCAQQAESRWALRSRQHLRSNLAGLRLTMEGCAAGGNLGFDDLLESVGAGALVTELRADLTAAETAIDALPNSDVAASIEANRDAVVRAHTAIRELTSFLKMEFSTTLQITSQRVEGDND